MKRKSPAKVVRKYPSRAADVPVNQEMLFIVRDQLSSQIKQLSSQIKVVEHGFGQDFHELKSEMHRVALLVEEQNARNRIVLDGLTSLFERQDRVEAKVDALQK